MTHLSDILKWNIKVGLCVSRLCICTLWNKLIKTFKNVFFIELEYCGMCFFSKLFFLWYLNSLFLDTIIVIAAMQHCVFSKHWYNGGNMKNLFEKESDFFVCCFFLIKEIVWSVITFLIFEFSGILPWEHEGELGFVSSSVVRVGSSQIRLDLGKPEMWRQF